MKLGLNIDHVATLRNARGGTNPSIQRTIEICNSSIDILTFHLREDRRHIKDIDLKVIKKYSKKRINMEMALTNEMISIANSFNPNFICLVPEKRKELTTEGGLNLKKIDTKKLKTLLAIIKSKKISLSAFINPDKTQISEAKQLGFDTVEIHTGSIENKITKLSLNRILKAIDFGKSLGLTVNIGHGLNYKNLELFKNNKNIDTAHIGHFAISESLFSSMNAVIKNLKKIIK